MSKSNKEKRIILVVEDEPENRRIFSEILGDLGYSVIAMPDGTSALSAIQNAPGIDLIITDYRMPDMSGLELVMKLRRILPAVPVIMITAFGSIENYFQSLSLGVFEYVNKPVGKTEFERVVKAALHEPKAA